MADLNLGQDVANKRERDSCRYGSLITINPSGYSEIEMHRNNKF